MTLIEMVKNLDKRMQRIEELVGLAEQPRKAPKAAPARKKHAVRTHANAKEGKAIRQEIVAFIKSRKKPTNRTDIGRAVRTKSSGALGWYLKDLRQSGLIKMTKRGVYVAK